MDGIDRSTAHSVHAVARGSVEETPATFLNAIATTKRQSHHCHLRLCTIVSILAQQLLLLLSQQPEFRVLAFARVCRSVQLFCLLADEHTHTRHGLPKERRPGAYACAVVEKLAFAAPLFLLCMSAAVCSVRSKQHSRPSKHYHSAHSLPYLLIYHTTIAYPLLPLPHPVPPVRLPIAEP